MIANIEHCENCDALLTEADDEQGVCIQCGDGIPPLRALLTKIAGSCHESYASSRVPDEQAVWNYNLNLGDVRLARRLLR